MTVSDKVPYFEPSNQEKPKITVEDGQLVIGARRFRLTHTGTAHDQQRRLEKIKQLLGEHTDVRELEKVLKNITKDRAPVRLTISQTGVSVGKQADQLSKIQSTSPQFEKTFQRIAAPIQEQEHFERELRTQLYNKKFSSKEVQVAIDSILEEQHMGLKRTFQGIKASEWGEKTLADILHEPGNEALQSALVTTRRSYHRGPVERLKRVEECRRELIVFLLSNSTRNPREIHAAGGGVFRQQVFQGKEVPNKEEPLKGIEELCTPNKGWPSEADKEEFRTPIEKCNTNLAFITKNRADGTKESVVVGRSGKSDHIERLHELVKASCLEQLECTQPAGFHRIEDTNGVETYEFQHVITTYLDPSFLKAVPEIVSALWKTPENERAALSTIMKELAKWPQEGIAIEVLRPGAPQDKIRVILKPPIVCNQLFSTTVRGFGLGKVKFSDMGQTRSDRLNFTANKALFETYLNRRNYRERPSIDAEAVNAPGFFKSKEYLEYHLEMARVLLEEIWAFPNYSQDAQALFALVFRRAPPASQEEAERLLDSIRGNTFSIVPDVNEMIHVADAEIWRNLLMKIFNFSHSKQCKSGTDRTAIGVALAVAQSDCAAKYHKEFLPDRMSSKELVDFKKCFRETLKEFGVVLTVETKGYYGIKWGGGVPLAGGIGNPVAYKYLFLAGEDAVADVEGVTRDDFAAKGNRQYKGRIIDPEGLYGKSDLKYAEKLKKTVKKLETRNPQLLGEVTAKIQLFVTQDLGCDQLADTPVLNKKLGLAVPVRQLHLDKEGRKEKLEGTIKDLEAKKDFSEVEALQLYVLRQLHTLWESREQSKKVLMRLPAEESHADHFKVVLVEAKQKEE